MMVVQSALLKREGFAHGFGTKGTSSEEYPDNTHILMQVHGDRVVVLTERSKIQDPKSKIEAVTLASLPPDPFQFNEGDAMVSDIPGVSMGIRTADCLPLLIVDRIGGAVAAVHCGWRSLALGLAGKVVRAMDEIMGGRREHLLAAIGPSIGPCCYQVGEEVRQAFPADLRGEGPFLHRGQKLYLDLASGVKTQIINAGINPESVDEIVACTSCSPDRFWSWRARKEEDRMVSFISVRGAYK